jgi:hypothetical protein
MGKRKTIKVSYGQTADEYVEIESLSDEERFQICMKLYKIHPTVESLKKAIDNESLKIIENII